jgi:hypothetical protein
MERYELKLGIIDEDYADDLIIALVRQGYSVYYNADEKLVCCTITDDDITEVSRE